MSISRLGPASLVPSSRNRLSSRSRGLFRLWIAATLAIPAVGSSQFPLEQPMASQAVETQSPTGGGIGVAPASPEPPVLRLSMQSLSNQELLKKGVDELNNKQYEEALATLQQVQPEPDWDEATRRTFADMLARAEKGATERRAARAAFEKGEAALAAGNTLEAIEQYRLAAENRFADEGTRAKAREQIAVAENLARKAATDLKSIFASAKADFRAGQYASAKAKFEQLKAAGYRTGLFEKSVSEYLKETEERIAAGFTGTPVAQTPPPQPVREVEVTPAPPTPEARAAAEQRYAEAEARASAEARRKEARDAYLMGRDQYRRGDWQSARENLARARELGFKPGLFEDSPEKLLARMDAKEQADAARAAREAQARAEREAAERAALEAEAALAAARAAEEAAAREAAQRAAEEQARRAAEVVAQAPAAPAEPPAAPSEPAPPAPTEPLAQTPAPAPSEPAAPTPPVTQAEPPTAPVAMDELRKSVEISRLEAEQNAFRARELVAKADEAAAAGRLDEALTLYTQATNLDPGNAAAAAGRTRMLQLTNREPAARDLLAEVDKQIRARREAITYSFNNAIERANAAIAQNNFRDAQAAISEARIARAQDPTIFQTSEINAFDATLADAQQRLESARVAFEQQQQAAAAADAAAAQAARLEAEALQRTQTIKSLRRTAMELTQQRKYGEALAVVNQIVELDPNDEYAQSMQIFLMDQAQFQRQRKYREQFDRQMTEQLIESEEKRIPYSDILRYPENWPELSEQRDRSVELERGASLEDQSLAGALERKLPDVPFDNAQFSDVIDFLRETMRVNIVVNWRALENAGIAKETPINVRLRDVRFSKVLTTVLADAGGGTVPLDYTIDDGVITISTKEDLSERTVTRVYDIRDLIINIPDFDDAPDFNLQQSAQVGGGGGGGSLFGGGGGGESTEGPTRA
ncbi:MAG: hypothetical protein RMJ35_06050, partial [Phycisphaerales bacterium]|nr:hypothetical protein [Phycisphaerales bacterium]